MAGKSFGERLKELRETAGLTQVELAARAGMHQFGVAKLEQGIREPTWASVQALARALGVSCSAFEDADGDEAEAAEPAPPEPPPERPRKRKRRPKPADEE